MDRFMVMGVDPGLVHTGVVRMEFNFTDRQLDTDHHVIPGPDAAKVKELSITNTCAYVVYIEGYRPRSHFNTDTKMMQAVHNMHAVVPGSKVLNNMGIKRVITDDLMKLLGVWSFSTPTHHQDLRSAARIGLYGMVKDAELNKLLYQMLYRHQFVNSWSIKNH